MIILYRHAQRMMRETMQIYRRGFSCHSLYVALDTVQNAVGRFRTIEMEGIAYEKKEEIP